MTDRRLCFAYGSLMRGMGNHRALACARFIRAAETAAAFTLHDLGAYPGMIGGGAARVNGELYDVDDETLAALDRLERHPRFYGRQEIALSDWTRVSAYLLPARPYARYPVVAGGDWRAHLARDRGTGDGAKSSR